MHFESETGFASMGGYPSRPESIPDEVCGLDDQAVAEGVTDPQPYMRGLHFACQNKSLRYWGSLADSTLWKPEDPGIQDFINSERCYRVGILHPHTTEREFYQEPTLAFVSFVPGMGFARSFDMGRGYGRLADARLSIYPEKFVAFNKERQPGFRMRRNIEAEVIRLWEQTQVHVVGVMPKI